ncbi:type 2 isopentenyl-diphosphate Delta-isomerase [Weissella cibaria]|uniref:type 2 isopentenyl-diphosphate Delta-isomerase n=1 Tax=Weissella cibaria TaxID=137591 RepID=UPI002A76358B|nr:type 2 isopentenyl-diphosphate Delta-isomerase [Weissella cibaria]MDY2519605.1 type 2 isopentenyl-diphosphate Delta-isomerase [Weissella cibaria]
MESAHAHRKDEHLSLAEAEFRRHAPVSSLHQVRIIHQGLPETKVANVDLTVDDPIFNFKTPFYIEAITGGSQKTGKINAQLATAAKETGLAMAVGSQSVALKDENAIDTFKVVREINPDGFVMANIGAGHTAAHAQEVVDMIGANALEVHINVAQEVVMPEGDREYIWQDELANIIQTVSVPVIIKEVGFGMAKETIGQLRDLGAQYINLGGRSGTNFAVIEDRRNRAMTAEHGYLYDWGQTTAESLLEAQLVADAPTILATGGIQDPLDVLKAQILGAKAVGVAGHFLHTVLNEGTEGVITEIQRWQNHLAKLYAMVGAERQADLQHVQTVLSPELKNYIDQRR